MQKILRIVLLLSFCLSVSVAFGQQPDTKVKPLDVILLIDSSPSTAKTDSANSRISAACLLIDFLTACSEVADVDYRVGMANFGGRLGDSVQLHPLLDGMVRDALHSEEIQLTDFRVPLAWALKQLRRHSFKTGNKMAVLLLTDSNPSLFEEPLSFEDKVRYFRGERIENDRRPHLKMNELVNELHTADASLFVVAIGDSRQDAKLWQSLIPPEHYRSIDRATDLANVYHRLFTDLIGTVASTMQTITPVQSTNVALPSYLEQVSFTFFKGDTSEKITLIDPLGKDYHPVSWQRHHDLHETAAIITPSAGLWKIQISNGSVLMWVDMHLPVLSIETERLLIVGSPVKLYASLQRRDMLIVDPYLQLEAQITSPSDTVEPSTKAFVNMNDGHYILSLEDLDAPGEYSVTVTAHIKEDALALRNNQKNFLIHPFSTAMASFKNTFFKELKKLPMLKILSAVVFILIVVLTLFFFKKLGAPGTGSYRILSFFAKVRDKSKVVEKIPVLKRYIFRFDGYVTKKYNAIVGRVDTDSHEFDDEKAKRDVAKLLNAVKTRPHKWLELLGRLARHKQPGFNRIAFKVFEDRFLDPDKAIEVYSQVTLRGDLQYLMKTKINADINAEKQS